MSDTCLSCGTPWIDHLGVMGTCRDLRLAKKEVARLRLRLKELEQERLNRKKGGRLARI
jgi:hypothetical protein